MSALVAGSSQQAAAAAGGDGIVAPGRSSSGSTGSSSAHGSSSGANGGSSGSRYGNGSGNGSGSGSGSGTGAGYQEPEVCVPLLVGNPGQLQYLAMQARLAMWRGPQPLSTAGMPTACRLCSPPFPSCMPSCCLPATQTRTAWTPTACQTGQHPSFQQCSPPALLCCRLGQPGRRQHARLVCTLLPICLTYCSFSPRRFRQPGCGQRARQV